MKICPFCQEEIKENAIKCKYCQSVLTSSGESSENSQTVVYVVDRGLLRFGKFVSAALALFIAAGLMLYGYDLTRMAKELDDTAKEVQATHTDITDAQKELDIALRDAKSAQGKVDDAINKARNAISEVDELAKKLKRLETGVVELAGPVDTPNLPKSSGPSTPRNTVNLRATPNTELSSKTIFERVQKLGFSLPGHEMYGNFQHSYELVEKDEIREEAVVIDLATGLMWQRSGSTDTMVYSDALKFVEKLNALRFAGHRGWRLPTLEELVSIVEPTENRSGMFIDDIFDEQQQWIRSVDKKTYNNTWGVVFYEGKLYFPTLNFPYYVRAVRSVSTQ